MHQISLRTICVTAAVVALGSCDQLSALGLGPPPAASAPPSTTPISEAVADLRPYAGNLYSDFIAGEGDHYGLDQAGLSAAEQARFSRAMAVQSAGALMDGGGAEALVFSGCAENGCDEGFAVFAVDTTSGQVFVGVRDGAGAEVLSPNDRIEALLRLNSPARAWDKPAPMQTASTETPNP
ncbi:MAG: hypothetical protein KF779_05675 [Hyphomonadaceae bacterium]|nr:hypothetical protein [Hyphomonadaceae bacterium]